MVRIWPILRLGIHSGRAASRGAGGLLFVVREVTVNEFQMMGTGFFFQTENDVPHPHELEAFGLANLKPPPISSSL